ncbi:hypothetical protein [Planomonospora algeriensis]
MHPDLTPDAAAEARQDDIPSRHGSRTRLFARIAARHNPHLDPGYLTAALAERDQVRTI